MSRINISHNGFLYVYGEDHHVGLFFEKYNGADDTIFDISEMVNFVDHPNFPKGRGRHIKREEIIEMMEWEIENNELPLNHVHLELIKNKKFPA